MNNLTISNIASLTHLTDDIVQKWINLHYVSCSLKAEFEELNCTWYNVSGAIIVNKTLGNYMNLIKIGDKEYEELFKLPAKHTVDFKNYNEIYIK